MAAVRDDALEQRVRALADPVVQAAGDVELVDVEVKGHPGSRVVRLTVDADGGVGVDTCAEMSRAVGAALDAADLISGRYTLQVTSPGADRPLRSARDFARNEGRPVRLQPRAGSSLPADQGVVVDVAEESLTLDVDGERVRVPLDVLDHGRVVLPW